MSLVKEPPYGEHSFLYAPECNTDCYKNCRMFGCIFNHWICLKHLMSDYNLDLHQELSEPEIQSICCIDNNELDENALEILKKKSKLLQNLFEMDIICRGSRWLY